MRVSARWLERQLRRKGNHLASNPAATSELPGGGHARTDIAKFASVSLGLTGRVEETRTGFDSRPLSLNGLGRLPSMEGHLPQ